MIIQVHLLKNFGPSNVNADLNGAPKTCVFGQALRSRISSQAIKYALRHTDIVPLPGSDVRGVRTRNMALMVEHKLAESGVEKTDIDAIVKLIPLIGKAAKKTDDADITSDDGEKPANNGKKNKKAGRAGRDADTKTSQLIFVSPAEVDILAEKLLAMYRDYGAEKYAKATAEDIFKYVGHGHALKPRAVDIALFGRMTTDALFEDVHSAVQMAHAISAHRIRRESDFFIAADDLVSDKGAGMMGDIEFNSATYYQYCSIDVDQLIQNLDGDVELAKKAILWFVKAFMLVHPQGKSNPFATNPLPGLTLVSVDAVNNHPVSYADAFIKPVVAGDEGLMNASIRQLSEHIDKLWETYDTVFANMQAASLSWEQHDIPHHTTLQSLSELMAWLERQLPA